MSYGRRGKDGKAQALWVFGLFTLLFIGWGVMRIVKYVQYDIAIEGHLKRAADSNTPQMAAKELRTAVNAIEARDWTKGYTSILWRTPDADLDFWYKNLKATLTEIEALPEEATGLERSNMLMKLRETILDDTSEGVSVTAPSGISIYPHNTMYAVWATLTGVMALVFGCLGGIKFLND
jgi:hypothetical protein